MEAEHGLLLQQEVSPKEGKDSLLLNRRCFSDAADLCLSNQTEEDSEQDFRESFYNSGTDWSSLYCVDDYGIPYESWDLASKELCSHQSGNSLEKGDLNNFSISRKEQSRVELPGNNPWPDLSLSKIERFKSSHNKLVQSSLSSCWERKIQKRDDMPSVAEAKLQTIENRLAMGETITTSSPRFWSKFNQPSASSAAEDAQSAARKSSAFPKSGVKLQGTFVTKRKCPFYKRIQGTSFTVDAFQYGAVADCKAYFLTHFHADHYGGLTKSWANGPIYCTPVTARLLALCLYVDEKWIHPLPLEKLHYIDGVEVKMLDANHCPGAAIIYFRLRNGQAILHTGDFRACKSMQTFPELREGNIHTLYLDTTYCNQRYRFPLQEVVVKFVVEVTQSALKKNSRTLVVVGAYSIGKERMYLGIAESLDVSIYAESRRRRILGVLEWPELVCKLSKDANSTLLHVLPMGHLRPQKLKAYLQGYPKYNAVLAFRPTGWTYSDKIGNELHLLKPSVSGNITTYGVPYSEHSSFTELREFVQFLQPENIIPTVNVGNPQTRERMKSYFQQWLKK